MDCEGDHSDYIDRCHWVNFIVRWWTGGTVDPTTNQRQGLDQQWDDGFRGFLLDAHYADGLFSGAVKFCHGNCVLGQVDALKWLQRLKRRMDQNPHDVVTLVFESYVNAADLRSVLRDARLEDMIGFTATGTQVRATTLATMVAPGGKRLVVLDGACAGQLGLHCTDRVSVTRTDNSQNTWIIEDQAAFKDPTKCRYRYRSPGVPVHSSVNVLNQFMARRIDRPAGVEGETQRTPSVDMSTFANHPYNVESRLLMCWEETGVRPSLIAVDHSDVGAVVAGVIAVNRMSSHAGWQHRRVSTWHGWGDGDRCERETNCGRCANPASFWFSRGGIYCGAEPCWAAGTRCSYGIDDSLIERCMSRCCHGYSCQNDAARAALPPPFLSGVALAMYYAMRDALERGQCSCG